MGPTDLKFLNSDRLGEKFLNDMFVGDTKYGNLYHFDLDASRSQLISNHSLADKIADNLQENEEAIFAQGFGGITNIEVGPDGYLYIVAIGGYVNVKNMKEQYSESSHKIQNNPCISERYSNIKS